MNLLTDCGTGRRHLWACHVLPVTSTTQPAQCQVLRHQQQHPTRRQSWLRPALDL